MQGNGEIEILIRWEKQIRILRLSNDDTLEIIEQKVTEVFSLDHQRQWQKTCVIQFFDDAFRCNIDLYNGTHANFVAKLQRICFLPTEEKGRPENILQLTASAIAKERPFSHKISSVKNNDVSFLFTRKLKISIVLQLSIQLSANE